MASNYLQPIVYCIALMLAACSESENNAPTQCKAFAVALCNVASRCDPATPYLACVTGASAELECDKAKSIGPTFDKCLSDLNLTACQAYESGQVTPSCVGVVEQ